MGILKVRLTGTDEQKNSLILSPFRALSYRSSRGDRFLTYALDEGTQSRRSRKLLCLHPVWFSRCEEHAL
jgi:hypothetical protein